MGMRTEFFFRAYLKRTTPAPLLDWLEQLAGDTWPLEPFEQHQFFTGDWHMTLAGAAATHHISRPPYFVRGADPSDCHELVLMASSKRIDVDGLLDWIGPHLDHFPGDFLGYTLYEDTRGCDPDDEDREQPTLIFMPDRSKR